MKRKLGIAIIFAMVVGVFLTGCGSDSSSSEKVKQIKDAGELVLLTNTDYPPFEYKDDNGDVVGLDIEIGQAIADELGVKLTVLDKDFDALVDLLLDGQGDIIISGLTITPERELIIDFSIPYEEKQQDMIVSIDSDVHSLNDLSGATVGAQKGSTSEQFLLYEMTETDGALFEKGVVYKPGKSNTDLIQDLSSGVLDAVMQDSMVSEYLIKDYPNLKALPAVTTSGKEYSKMIAVATQQEHPDLLDVINEVLRRLLDDGDITKWKELY